MIALIPREMVLGLAAVPMAVAITPEGMDLGLKIATAAASLILAFVWFDRRFDSKLDRRFTDHEKVEERLAHERGERVIAEIRAIVAESRRDD